VGQLKTFLVVNPASGNGSTGRNFEAIAKVVKGAVGEFEHGFTKAPMDAVKLSREALRQGFECIVAVGGDGTTNEVVNGFFQDGAPVKAGAALAILPRGTGGDFRKTFRWGTELEEAAARLKGDATQPLDVGRIEFVDHQGASAIRYFVNIASAGVSGQVDAEVNRSSKVLGGKASFALASLKALMKYQDRRIRFSLDGGPMTEVSATCFAVANGQYFGGGMWIAPDARPDDGIFDLTLWTGYGLVDFVFKSKSIYNGKHVEMPNTQRFQARKVRLETDEEVLLDIDGEQPGRAPATFEMLPGALRLKV
jgi:YegS/Rv2252/BmrU family lipid kinase